MLKNKYHRPIEENLKYIESLVKDGAKVLELYNFKVHESGKNKCLLIKQ